MTAYDNVNRIESPSAVKIDETVIIGTPNQNDAYVGKVSKVTAKSVQVVCPALGHEPREFRLQSIYGKGEPYSFRAYGRGNYGFLYPATPELLALVAATQAAAEQRVAEFKAKRQAAENERAAFAARERADALAANANVTWTQIGKLGAATYYATNMVNSWGNDCFVVIAASQRPDRFNWEDRNAVAWFGALNYGCNDSEHVGTMASCSPDVQGATLDAMLTEAIVRVW